MSPPDSFLRGNDRGCSLANGLSIESVIRLEAQEKPFLQARGRIKQDVVPNRVLVEESNAPPDHSLSIAAGIPGKAELGSKIEIGLMHCVPEAAVELIVELVRAGRGPKSVSVRAVSRT